VPMYVGIPVQAPGAPEQLPQPLPPHRSPALPQPQPSPGEQAYAVDVVVEVVEVELEVEVDEVEVVVHEPLATHPSGAAPHGGHEMV